MDPTVIVQAISAAEATRRWVEWFAKPTEYAPALKTVPLPGAPPGVASEDEGVRRVLALLDESKSRLGTIDAELLSAAQRAGFLATTILCVSAVALTLGVLAALFAEPLAGGVVAVGSAIGGGAGARHFFGREREAYERLERAKPAWVQIALDRDAFAILATLPDGPEKNKAIVELVSRMSDHARRPPAPPSA